MRLLIVPAVLLFISQNGNEAEKLFQQMSKKLAEANEVQISSEATFESGKKEGKLKATIRLAKGNKSNTEINAEFGGTSVTMKIVSDGSKMKVVSDFIKKSEVKDTPESLNATMIGGIQRGGVLMSTMAVESSDKKKQDIAERFKISDFSLGKKEKLGEHEAQALKYKLKVSDEPEIINVELWVDAATQLPLKRILTGKSNIGGNVKVTETYKILLNPKAQPELFKLDE